MGDRKTLLVGDNPFHGVSHISQERAMSRGKDLANPGHAAELVMASIENGADGFAFTTSETTLSILRVIGKQERREPLRLHALVPNVVEFTRTAAVAGGIPGLARKLATEIVISANIRAVANGVKGVATNDPAALLRGLLSYEVSRIKSAMGRGATLVSISLHELVTDMALALNADWLFRTHISFARGLGIRPGFETRNFACLTTKFEEWGIDFAGVVITAPFNSIGFQMYPSKKECEEALSRAPQAETIGFSILAAGYLSIPEAIDYVSTLPGLDGVAVGVSTMQQASETFGLLSERLAG